MRTNMFMLLALAAVSCGDAEPITAASLAPLMAADCERHPDYTQEELEALAASPEVFAALEPFGQNVTAPDRALYVEMSDGVKIALSLFFPPGLQPDARAAPSAYVESWYGRRNEQRATAIELYRAAGFVVAIADPRGFATSFGSQPTFLSELQRQDQREMIAWIARQPWSNGRVAAVGISVSAMLAEATLASGAPELGAGVVRATEWDQYSENLFVGGVPNPHIHALIDSLYVDHRGVACVADLAACAQIGIQPVDADSDYTQLQAALREHDANLPAGVLAGLAYSDDRAGGGGFDDVSPKGRVEQLREYALPARVAVSWLDGMTAQAALERYAALPDVPMEVVISATTHLGGLSADPFEREAFTPAVPSAQEQFAADIAFLERALRGEAIERGVRYRVLGSDVWKSTPSWPPSGVERETLQLSRTQLRKSQPRAAGERSYAVDPRTSTGPMHNRWASQGNAPVYYGDRNFAPGQRLAFDGAPLAADVELVGAAELCLAMRSDQSDGSVFAYLEDVAPDGRVTYLTEGVLRLIHRKTASGGCDDAPGTSRSFSRADASAVTPGELMEVEIPLLPVAARIRAGHRLRLSLAGADEGTFPLLTQRPGTWSIAYGAESGSQLIVPMRPWSD